MAPEGTEQVVEQPGGGSSTTESQKPAADTTGQPEQKVASPPGASTGQNEDYEKRFKGITADLQKERAARQRYEKDLAEARAETERERKRARLLFDENPRSEKETEEAEIKARLKALGVPMLSQEDLDAVREARAAQAESKAATQHHWVQHGRRMVGGVFSEIEKSLGGNLSDRQRARIQAEYVREAENSQTDENGDALPGTFLWRHEQGDPKLASDFAKQLEEDFFEPARRKVTQQETQRFRAVPSGKDRGIVTTPHQKIDVNDSKAVEDLLVKSYREKHGDFTGRK